ncbi:MAG: DNA polymerase I [Coriobacteriia bacterium]|nr:DNA polymerase I [Coriobacteriia bacterium]
MNQKAAKAQTESQKKVLIVDGHSWMHRAFHAMQASLTAPDGQPTNAVFGFFSILSKTLNQLRPDAVVVAFDEGRPTARIEALAQYKIQRLPTDPDLKSQFPIIKELLAAMQIPVACVPNVEGDDILGTLAKQGEQLGLQVYLATSDRDAYQLVSESTKIVSQGRAYGGDDGGLRIIGPAEVEERYGITPAQVIDFLGLKGDPGDNIPGVPSVGEKTAARLLAQYGTLDAVLQAATEGEIKGRVGQNLTEHKEAAEVSRIVATILCDVPLDINLCDLEFGHYTAEDLHEPFMRYGLRSPLNWMLKLDRDARDAADKDENLDDTAEEDDPTALISTSPYDSTAAQNSPYKGVVIASSGDTLFDNEQILAVSGVDVDADKDKDGDLPAVATITQAPSIADVLAQLLQENQQLAAPDLKALFTEVAAPDNALIPNLDPQQFSTENDFDLSLAAYLLASHKNDFSLKALALEYADIELFMPTEDEAGDGLAAKRAASEAELIARLAGILEDHLDKSGSLELYRQMELPLIPVLARMEHAGISICAEKLDELAQYGRARIDVLREEIYTLAGTSDFNLDSPKQLAEILFDRLELPVIKKTRTGRSTNAAVLAELKAHHPIAAKITEYREFTKLQSTYLEAFPRLIAKDGRIHTSFNQAVTATGRLSSSRPNLQNIPIRTEMGRRIREAFVPQKGWKLLSADYSQIELRVLAELSGDEGLIEAFNSGEDFHAETAVRIFGLDSEQAKHIDSGLRSKAKAVNFGIIYGQGPHGLGQALDISFGEAKQIIDRYYASFPRVKNYLDETIQEAKEQGWVKTYFGRKRHIPELQSSSRALHAFGERTAMNHPMQGTAADLVKLAMVAVDHRLRDSGLQARMLLQVHDELVFEAPEEECAALSELVVRAMTQVAPDFTVPLEVNVTIGDTWA